MFLAAAIDATYAYFLCVCHTYKTRLNKPDEEEKKEEEKKEEEKKEEEKKDDMMEPEMMAAE
jgi:ribosomal protein L12E/L44/L45/RPP1/RPP2